MEKESIKFVIQSSLDQNMTSFEEIYIIIEIKRGEILN